jgi:hypothetical protein
VEETFGGANICAKSGITRIPEFVSEFITCESKAWVPVNQTRSVATYEFRAISNQYSYGGPNLAVPYKTLNSVKMPSNPRYVPSCHRQKSVNNCRFERMRSSSC